MGIIQISGGHALTMRSGGIMQIQPPSNVYQSLVLDSNPLGFWKLDELAGTSAVDSSTNTTTGTYTGPSYRLANDALVAGFASSAFIQNRAFNNGGAEGSGLTDSYVLLLDNVAGGHPFTTISDASDTFTLEAWIQTNIPDTTYGANERTDMDIIQLVNNNTPETRVAFAFGVDEGLLAMCRRSGGTSEKVVSNTRIDDGLVHHVLVTVNNTTRQVRFYVDGAFETVKTFGVGLNGADTSVGSDGAALIIGAHQRPSGGRTFSGFAGAVSAVAVYPTILGDPVILSHYNTGSGEAGVTARTTVLTEIAADSPLLHYRFNENLASVTAVDSGSLAYDATYEYPFGSQGEEQAPAPIVDIDSGFRHGFLQSNVEVFNLQSGGHPFTTFGNTSYTIEFWMYHTGTFFNGSLWYPGRSAAELRHNSGLAGTTIPFSAGFDAGNGGGGANFGRMMIGFSDNYTSNDDRLHSNNDVVLRYARHHCVYVVTITGGPSPYTRTVDFYLDGANVGTDSNATIGDVSVGSNPASFNIGMRTTNNGSNGTSQAFEGVMQNFALYNTALSPARILAHYNAGVA